MGRTRLRGLDVAGLRVAVEAPADLPWEVRSPGLRRLEAAPFDADLYLGVRVDLPRRLRPAQPVRYACPGGALELGREGGGWVATLSEQGAPRLVAQLDASLGEGEIAVHPETARALLDAGESPLPHPLDEALLLHRLVREGVIALRGTLEACGGGRARLVLGEGRPGSRGPRPSWLLVRATGRRARVHLGPWHDETPVASGALLVEIEQIELAGSVPPEILDPDDAAPVLLAHAFAPVHDPEGAEAAVAAAAALAEMVPLRRTPGPSPGPRPAFDWGQRSAALAFAPPGPQ